MNAEAIDMRSKGFKKEEAITYLNFEVAKKGEDRTGKSIVDTNGIVIGLLVLNNEIELVIQWSEGLKQYTKSEFFNQVEIIDG